MKGPMEIHRFECGSRVAAEGGYGLARALGHYRHPYAGSIRGMLLKEMVQDAVLCQI